MDFNRDSIWSFVCLYGNLLELFCRMKMVVQSIHCHISLAFTLDKSKWVNVSSMVWLGLFMMLTFLLVGINSYDTCRWHGIIYGTIGLQVFS